MEPRKEPERKKTCDISIMFASHLNHNDSHGAGSLAGELFRILGVNIWITVYFT